MSSHALVPPVLTQAPGHPWSWWHPSFGAPVAAPVTYTGTTTIAAGNGMSRVSNILLTSGSWAAASALAASALPGAAGASAVPGYYADAEGGEQVVAWLVERREQTLAFLAASATLYETCYLGLVEGRQVVLSVAAQPCAFCEELTCAGVAQCVDPRHLDLLHLIFACPFHLHLVDMQLANTYTHNFCLCAPSEMEALRLPPRELRRLRQRVMQRLLRQVKELLVLATAPLWQPTIPWWRLRRVWLRLRLRRTLPTWRDPTVSYRAPDRSPAKGPAP